MSAQPQSLPIQQIAPGSANLFNLFFRPQRFFMAKTSYQENLPVFLTAWIVGIANVIDRVSKNLMRDSQDLQPRIYSGPYLELADTAWPNFWIGVVIAGLIAAGVLWIFGGWWYRVRLDFSGVPQTDRYLARVVYIYSTLIYALPVVFFTGLYTWFYSSYRVAYNGEDLYTLLMPLFLFWSIYVSYRGVRTAFPVRKWRARIWFLIVPSLIYGAAFIIAIVALMQMDL